MNSKGFPDSDLKLIDLGAELSKVSDQHFLPLLVGAVMVDPDGASSRCTAGPSSTATLKTASRSAFARFMLATPDAMQFASNLRYDVGKQLV